MRTRLILSPVRARYPQPVDNPVGKPVVEPPNRWKADPFPRVSNTARSPEWCGVGTIITAVYFRDTRRPGGAGKRAPGLRQSLLQGCARPWTRWYGVRAESGPRQAAHLPGGHDGGPTAADTTNTNTTTTSTTRPTTRTTETTTSSKPTGPSTSAHPPRRRPMDHPTYHRPPAPPGCMGPETATT